jgi:N-acetylglutamate synthase-like GNAT family acetyltransferase
MGVFPLPTVKGGGSALLDYTLQRYKARGIEKVQLLSTQDKYYLNRGWKVKSNADEACTVM